MWKKNGYQAVGGMREAGFIEGSDFLMVLGRQGRTVFNCLTNEKSERDRQNYYLDNWDSKTGMISGIGKFEGQHIKCGGFEYPDQLKKRTQDNWLIQIREEKRITYKNEHKLAQVMYLVNPNYQEKLELKVFHYQITRAYGFSPTGKSFVITESDGITMWIRNEHIAK